MAHALIPIENRFWPKVDRSQLSPGGCWLWTGSTNKGYGLIGDGYGKLIRAHRFSFHWAYGPIPPGLSVCHRCDNPSCVNPTHLFLGTHLDNMADRNSKGRQSRASVNQGEASGMAKLTEVQVMEIRALYAAGGITHRALGELYGVTGSSVSHIVNRQTWTHVA